MNSNNNLGAEAQGVVPPAGLKIFEKPEFGQVRVVIDESNEPWFVGIDVAKVLGYVHVQQALTDNVDDEDKKLITSESSPIFKIGLLNQAVRQLWLINESGLYSLIIRSNLATAKDFKRWVTHEVLPSIRKTGKYETKQEALSPLDAAEQSTRALLHTIECMQAQAKKIRTLEGDVVDLKTSVIRAEQRIETFMGQEDWFTIKGYASLLHIPLSEPQAATLGKRAVQLCNLNGIAVQKVHDVRYGQINSYPEFILKQIFLR
jgi:prophage antirepressor-like protein